MVAVVPGAVALCEGMSAAQLMHRVLLAVAGEYSSVLGGILPASADHFRRDYPQLLPQFEATRLGSGQRLEIAIACVRQLQSMLCWQPDGVDSQQAAAAPLTEALQHPADEVALQTHQFDATTRWQPAMAYRGQRYGGAEIATLGDVMVERGVITPAAGRALRWLSTEALTQGRLDLAGRKIALLGAGAEMAPTRFWLEAGAHVLWLDTRPPPADWWQRTDLAGRLTWPEEPVDLLTQPQQILSTLQAFADGDPLDIGLYAYAGGQARELRLTGIMNALVDALPRGLCASATMLVSPTTPTGLTAEDREVTRTRLQERPWWQSALGGVGLLGRGRGYVEARDGAATRSVVDIQGASYQAAQYLGKVLSAECWAAGDIVPRVSANTAAITKTRSLDHPVFTAAFGGAIAFGVETLVPRQSQCLNGLLAVHDWLHPDTPNPGEVRVHGGIHSLPYALGSALRIAAGIGFVKNPRLLRGLVSRS